MRPFIAVTLIALAAPAGAQDNIRILPDQAVLACQARTMRALEEQGAVDPKPVERFETEAMENFRFRVKGVLSARVEGAPHRVAVECEVSSAGVEVFTMEVGADG